MKRTLRFLSVILCACALLGCIPFSVSAKEIKVKFNGINTARGSGQLIVYTSDYGERTNTNEWGAEAVVGADHKVTAVGANNNAIPAGGFVLSGHDSDEGAKMKTWVKTNVAVGDYVYYNDRNMEITVSDVPLNLDDKVFYELTVDFTNMNGTRYENNLIIYNNKGSNTNTNEYGYEVVVTSGIVTFVGGNNSKIPAASGSFVVSGHGTAADWLRTNVILGMGCSFDVSKKKVTFVFDAESMVKGLSLTIEQAKKSCEEAKKLYRYIDYDTFDKAMKDAEKKLSDAEKAYKKNKNEAEFASACDEINAILTANKVTESYTVQYRGAWLRPSQKSASEVDAFVQKLYEQGINTVCVEGIFDCSVIFTVPEDSLIPHNPAFNYDVLQAYIDACHKRGMECHLWMAIYHVANFGNKNYNISLAKKKPDWLAKDETGNPDNENRFCMIDPANEEARAYQVSFYKHIIKNYDIDCFELDYIRYAVRTDHDYGYTDAAIKGFQKAYNTTAVPTFDVTASYWVDWCQFRKDSISKLVKEVREMINAVNPDVILAADVVADPSQAGIYNYQDYLRWEKEGWLDVLHPMAYGDGFDEAIKEQIASGGDKCGVAVGLGVFMDELDAAAMVRQACRDNDLSAMGEIYFEASAYLADKAGAALLQNAYKNAAIPPFLDRDASIKASLAYMNDHIKDVILPLGGMTEAEANAVIAASEAAAESVADAKIAPEKLSALHEAISAVKKTLAKRALNADLYRAEQISCITYKVTKSELGKELTKPEPTETSEESTDAPVEESTAAESEEESVPASESQTESKAESEAETSGEEKEEKDFPWMWIGFGAFAVAAVCGAIVLILNRKKRKK